MRIEKLRSIRSRAVFVALFLALGEAQSSTVAVAGVNAWTQIGPEGGPLCGIAVAPSDPLIVYAVGYGAGQTTGFFRSEDGGQTWVTRSAPVDSFGCDIAVDSADPLRIYSIHFTATFQRSFDGGATWEQGAAGLPALAARSPVAVDPNDPNFLLILSLGQLHRSRDRGETWQQIWQTGGEPTIANVVEVAVDPLRAGRVFAVTTDQGLFLSTNYGDDWSPVGQGLPPFLDAKKLVFDPADHSVIYLLAHNGIYRTQNGGALWSQVLSNIYGSADGISFLAVRSDSALFAFKNTLDAAVKQILGSGDQGDTWQVLSSTPSMFPVLGISGLVANPDALLATSRGGIFRSTDDGATWQESKAGLLGAELAEVELDRQNPESMFALDGRNYLHSFRVFRSLDGGAAWQTLVPPEPLSSAMPMDLAVDPNRSRRLFATTFYGDAVLRSEDAGATWTPHPAPFSCLYLQNLVPDLLAPERLYLVGTPDQYSCGESCVTFRSDDLGTSWQCIGAPLADRIRQLAPNPHRGGEVLALGFRGIYRSSNSGDDWTLAEENPIGPGLTSPFMDVEWATAEIAYAAKFGAGLYVSRDSGATWGPVSAGFQPLPLISDLVVDRIHPLNIYVLSASSEVGRSIDGGVSWDLLSSGLRGWNLSALRIDPVTPNRLYVSAAGGGILAYDVQVPEPCVPSATALCITDGRFKIESLWRDFAGRSGVGHAVPLAADTGAFWFFDPDNLELFAKEIDGVSYNNAFWTFYGALSNVEFTLLATDTATGAQHGYFNRRAQFASKGDIESFPQEVGSVTAVVREASTRSPLRRRAAPQRSVNACVPNATTLCLAGGRFAASVTWRDFAGRTGVGTPLVLTPDTGSFWFFDAGIHELAVKVIDGRGTNNAYWVFFGSLSNVEFALTVVDTETGDIWTRDNPLGTFASDGDIEAFPQLP